MLFFFLHWYNQTKPIYEQKKQNISAAGSIAGCFEFKFGGDVKTPTSFTQSAASNKTDSVFVTNTKVDIDVTLKDGSGAALYGTGVTPAKFETTVDINKLLSK